MKQKSSLMERLAICWNVLTKKNYIYFGVGKKPITWNEDGSFKEVGDKQLVCYACVDYDYKFNEKNGKEVNLHDFVWGIVGEFAQLAQKGEA